MTPEERVKACLSTSRTEVTYWQEYLLPKDYVARLVQMMEEAVAAEQMRCYQIARGEADQWHALWRPVHREGDSLAEYGFLAAELIASLLSQSPD